MNMRDDLPIEEWFKQNCPTNSKEDCFGCYYQSDRGCRLWLNRNKTFD